MVTEVWNNRNTDIIPELIAANAKGHLEGGQEIVGPDGFITFQKALLEALPDIHVEIVNSLSDGDDTCVHWVATATHSGRGFGLEPTGKTVSFRGITWLHVLNGKIAEGWDCWNQGGLFAAITSPA